jgi:hypothetical protein
MKRTIGPSRIALPAHTRLSAIAASVLMSVLCATAEGRGEASAATPIAIDHCTVDEATAIQNPKVGVHPSTVDGIEIGYTNESDAGAVEVRFRVRYGGKPLTFVDRGTIAAHAKVNREFSNFSLVYLGSSVECRVLSATFADGTRWDAPDVTPAPAATR